MLEFVKNWFRNFIEVTLKTVADIVIKKAMAPVKIGSFTDTRDGKTYKTVRIGEQTWMAENLAYECEGSKCYPTNCQKYGMLYDWETAKKACPSGWHLPTNAEWDILTAAVGGEETAGKYLKATSGWNNDGSGTDAIGFSALPGGCGLPDGSFGAAGEHGYWWCQ